MSSFPWLVVRVKLNKRFREEMVLDHPVTNLSSAAVILVWISSANVKAVVDKGFRVIHAASDYLYLDCEWLSVFEPNWKLTGFSVQADMADGLATSPGTAGVTPTSRGRRCVCSDNFVTLQLIFCSRSTPLTLTRT